MEAQLKECIKRAEKEELGADMRQEAIHALIRALHSVAPAFPTLAECLMAGEIYEEAERFYFDDDDEFPLKYVSALKSIAITMQEETEDEDEETEPPRGSIAVILGDTPRQQVIEAELDFFCKKAADDHMEGIEMRSEAIKALKLGAKNLAYRKKFYDAEKDKFLVIPSVPWCLVDNDLYEAAEKEYYGPKDEFPLKYTSALRSLGIEAGGAEEDVEEMQDMAMDCASTDGYFENKPLPVLGVSIDSIPDELYEKEPEPVQEVPVTRGSTAKILGETPRQKCIERELNFFIKKAADEHLDEAMRDEAIKAIKLAGAKYAYKRKFYDAESDKIIVFPSVSHCLIDNDIYEEAEEHYYDKDDDFPMKYTGALRSLGLESGGAEEDVEEWNLLAMDCESTDGFFENKSLPTASAFEYDEASMDQNIEVDDDEDDEDDGEPERGSVKQILGDTPRQKVIETEINFFAKKAAEEHFEGVEMRSEAIKALKIGANQYAYKKKYYDAEKDMFVVFPSVANCLLEGKIYNAAQKKYYGLRDEFPLKYTSAMRSVGIEAGGAEEDVEEMQDMAMDCASTDGYFENKPLPVLGVSIDSIPDELYEKEPETDQKVGEKPEEDCPGRGSTAQILSDTSRQNCIEAELNVFIKRAGEEYLDGIGLRNEAIKALKIGANQYAYKKKFYDAENDKFIVFPSVAHCLVDNDIYDAAEKNYYDEEDEFPLKYTSAMRSLGIDAGGTDEDVERMVTMAMDVDSTDGFFANKALPFTEPPDEIEVEGEPKKTKKKKKKSSEKNRQASKSPKRKKVSKKDKSPERSKSPKKKKDKDENGEAKKKKSKAPEEVATIPEPEAVEE